MDKLTWEKYDCANFDIDFDMLQGLKKVRSNGMGVHTAEEIENFGKKDLQTLSEMLGDKEFFFGDEPAMLDLVVFSHVAQLVMVDKEHSCALRDYLEADCKNLVGLVNRMKDRCWNEHWENATGEEMDLNPHIPKVKLNFCSAFQKFKYLFFLARATSRGSKGGGEERRDQGRREEGGGRS